MLTGYERVLKLSKIGGQSGVERQTERWSEGGGVWGGWAWEFLDAGGSAGSITCAVLPHATTEHNRK